VCSADDRFCGNCGASLGSAAPQPQPRRRRPRQGVQLPGPLAWFLELFPGLVSPTVLVASILTLAFSAIAFGLAVFFIRMGVLITAFAIGGGAVMIYWTGWSWLLCGYVATPVEAMSDFQGKHWFALMMLTVVPAGVALAIVKMGMGS
jgi:hypothetical protein